MSPQTTPASAQKSAEHTASLPPAVLTKHELPAHQAKYIVTRTEMEEFLQKTFGAGLDFNVSTKNGRWIYYAERSLSTLEISKWIAELDKRKKAEARARATATAAGGSRG